MKRLVVLFAVIGLILVATGFGLSQTGKDMTELRREIDALKAGQTAIQKDLAEIKNLLLQKQLQDIKDMLQARPAPAPAPAQAQPPQPVPEIVFNLDGAMIKGDRTAKVTLIEFTDFQCPFCARHYRETVPQIEKEYVKTGKVRYVLKDFPLESIHPQAFKGHEAANCAADQNKYWEMHDKLFANQRAMAPANLLDYGKSLGLDMKKFQQCLDSGKYAAKVRMICPSHSGPGLPERPHFSWD